MSDQILDYWEGQDNDVHLVIAQYFDQESEAHLAVARLREAGIQAALNHSLIASTLPLGSGSIRLYVLEQDLAAACRILAVMEQKMEFESERFFQDADEDDIRFLSDLRQNKRKPAFYWVILAIVLLIFLFLRTLYSFSQYMAV
jgi:hypothetical protein